MSTRKEMRDYARYEFERYRDIEDLVCPPHSSSWNYLPFCLCNDVPLTPVSGTYTILGLNW